MVNIIVFVKKRRNELLLLPVPRSIPQNQNYFFWTLSQKYKFWSKSVAYSSQKFICVSAVKEQVWRAFWLYITVIVSQTEGAARINILYEMGKPIV